MNKRQVKKMARNFLWGMEPKGIPFRYETRYPNNDGSCSITERIPRNKLFREYVDYYTNYIKNSHWDSPFIVSIDYH